MKNVAWIVGQVIIAFGCIYGLYKTGVINSQLAVAVGMLIVVFMFSFDEVKKDLRKDLYPIKNALYLIKNALAELQKYMREHSDFIPLHEIKPAGYVVENSPIKNTPLGEKLLNESGARKLIDDNYIEFERKIDEQKCLTAYDVQTRASRTIARMENEKIMKPLKDFIYQHPKFYENPLALADMQRVMVVYLRDLYLQKHPGILPDEESQKT